MKISIFGKNIFEVSKQNKETQIDILKDIIPPKNSKVIFMSEEREYDLEQKAIRNDLPSAKNCSEF